MTMTKLAKTLGVDKDCILPDVAKSKPLSPSQIHLLESVLNNLPFHGDDLLDNMDDELTAAGYSWEWETVAETKAVLKWARKGAGWAFIYTAHSIREAHGRRKLSKFLAWAGRE